MAPSPSTRGKRKRLKYIPLSDTRVVLAFHGWTVYSNPSADIPFYLLPTMGGNRTNRSFHNFMFSDNSLLVLQAESRLLVWEHMYAALFVDAGNVAQHYGESRSGQRSYGARLACPHRQNDPGAVGRGTWHCRDGAVFSTTEPFRLPRAPHPRHSVLPISRDDPAVDHTLPCAGRVRRPRLLRAASGRRHGIARRDVGRGGTARTTCTLAISSTDRGARSTPDPHAEYTFVRPKPAASTRSHRSRSAGTRMACQAAIRAFRRRRAV
jgi:hypothetical protein